MIRFLIAVGLVLCPAFAAAQPKPESPSQPSASQTYVHSGSRMAAPPQLAGFERRQVTDATGSGRDVAVQYRTEDEETILTVYFYRSPYPSAGLWFEQARRSLEANPMFGGGVASGRRAQSFAASRSAGEDGLLIAYPVQSGRYRSTALALAMTGNWIVKLRMTSASLDEAAISTRIAEAAQGLIWPSGQAGSIGAIAACSTRAVPAQAAAEAPSTPALAAEARRLLTASVLDSRPAPVCFERQEGMLGIYRSESGSDGYLMALGDNGRLARVRRLDRQDPASLYVVEFYDLDAAHVAGFFRGMPSPQQALQASDSAFRTGGIARVGYLDGQVRPDESGRVPVT